MGKPDDDERDIEIQLLLSTIKECPADEIRVAVIHEKESADGLYEMYLDLILMTGEI
jgi:hypothetical protein